jgi:predicted nucleic acid-binding protein
MIRTRARGSNDGRGGGNSPQAWPPAAYPLNRERRNHQLAAWFAAPAVRLIGETTEEFDRVLGGFLRRPRVRGPIVHDARVAAICVAHGVTKLLSRDRDFQLFPELPLEDPLA